MLISIFVIVCCPLCENLRNQKRSLSLVSHPPEHFTRQCHLMQELTLGFPVPELLKGYVKARMKKIMSSLPGLESTGFPQGGFMLKYSYLCFLQIKI